LEDNVGIRLINISKKYGNKKVIDNMNMELPERGVVTLFGPSGCGKTTLINIIAGLDKDYAGKIEGLEGKRISVAFQEDRLLPWADITKNLSLVENNKEFSKVSEFLELVGLQDVENKLPSELSGGMKRRVAIARALVYGGDVYLLDEPFKGLDIEIKKKIMDYIKELSKEKLIILITHEMPEAEYLSGKIYNL